jgi:hypothetical protein
MSTNGKSRTEAKDLDLYTQMGTLWRQEKQNCPKLSPLASLFKHREGLRKKLIND